MVGALTYKPSGRSKSAYFFDCPRNRCCSPFSRTDTLLAAEWLGQNKTSCHHPNRKSASSVRLNEWGETKWWFSLKIILEGTLWFHWPMPYSAVCLCVLLISSHPHSLPPHVATARQESHRERPKLLSISLYMPDEILSPNPFSKRAATRFFVYKLRQMITSRTLCIITCGRVWDPYRFWRHSCPSVLFQRTRCNWFNTLVWFCQKWIFYTRLLHKFFCLALQ